MYIDKFSLPVPRWWRSANWTQPQPTRTELRARLGASLSDEELLLRALFSGEEVDAMLAAGPSAPIRARSARRSSTTSEALVRESRSAGSLSVTTPAYSITLSKAGGSASYRVGPSGSMSGEGVQFDHLDTPSRKNHSG